MGIFIQERSALYMFGHGKTRKATILPPTVTCLQILSSSSTQRESLLEVVNRKNLSVLGVIYSIRGNTGRDEDARMTRQPCHIRAGSEL